MSHYALAREILDTTDGMLVGVTRRTPISSLTNAKFTSQLQNSSRNAAGPDMESPSRKTSEFAEKTEVSRLHLPPI